MTMRLCVLACAALLLPVALFAQSAEFVYVDYPEVEIKRAGTNPFLADFGDRINAGDSVITTPFGAAELELEDGGTVSVAPDTVYQLQVVGGQRESQTVMNVAFGQVSFRFNTLAGRREPAVGTPTSVAGVRGTAFTTYVAADGSTVFVVDEGQVDVTAEGATVQLVAGEGVEVVPGEEPGEPFDALERAFDFADYNAERIEAFLADPVRSVNGHARRLAEFADQIEILRPLYEEGVRRRNEARAKLDTLEGDDRQTFFEEELVPIRAETANYFDNMRFYALSGLSMRRYVLGRMYLLMSLEYLGAPNDPIYREFRAAYDEALEIYETRIVPVLDPTDL
jgi:hypothetical protein